MSLMQNEDLSFVSLRKHPELLEETANLLNTVWPKSLTARLHYLAESEDDFPCSLILLQRHQHHHPTIIGHSRLNKVLGKPNAAFLTCVVIAKAKRGCGLGKMLMELTETYASQLGCTAIYLSTVEKCEFYKHLGYEYCCQVSPVKTSSRLFTSSQLTLLQGQSAEQELQMEYKEGPKDNENSVLKNNNTDAQDSETSLHKCGIDPDLCDTDKQDKTCANKIMSFSSSSSSYSSSSLLSSSSSSSSSSSLQNTAAAAPPTPPPPPVTLPTPPAFQQLKSQPSRTVLAGSYWMMKEL